MVRETGTKWSSDLKDNQVKTVLLCLTKELNINTTTLLNQQRMKKVTAVSLLCVHEEDKKKTKSGHK